MHFAPPNPSLDLEHERPPTLRRHCETPNDVVEMSFKTSHATPTLTPSDMERATWNESQTEVIGFVWSIPDAAMEPEFPRGWSVLATRVDPHQLEIGEAILIELNAREFQICYFVKQLKDSILGLQKFDEQLRPVFLDVARPMFRILDLALRSASD
jgi:hypothetical protein